jgi:hypothetical protein
MPSFPPLKKGKKEGKEAMRTEQKDNDRRC